MKVVSLWLVLWLESSSADRFWRRKPIKALLSSGHCKGSGKCFPLTMASIMFHFTSSDDRDNVLLEGPWVLDDAVLAIVP